MNKRTIQIDVIGKVRELRNAHISGLANTFARSSESTSSATIINSRPADS